MEIGFWLLSILYRTIAEEERKKRREKERKKRRKEEKKEKKKRQGCHLWGSLWDEICRFFLDNFFSWICIWAAGLSPVGLYLGWDLSDFFFIIFFPEFVYELSHVGLYLGWDLSDFIYLFIFLNLCELSPVCGLLLSQFFFF